MKKLTLEQKQALMRAGQLDRDVPQFQDWHDPAIVYHIQGESGANIGRRLSRSAITVNKFLATEYAQKKIAKLRRGVDFRAVKRKLNEGLEAAAKLIVDTIKDENVDLKTRISVAENLLTRQGVKEADRKEVTNININDSIAEALGEAAKEHKEESSSVGHA